jgi:hypothetical protein
LLKPLAGKAAEFLSRRIALWVKAVNVLEKVLDACLPPYHFVRDIF